MFATVRPYPLGFAIELEDGSLHTENGVTYYQNEKFAVMVFTKCKFKQMQTLDTYKGFGIIRVTGGKYIARFKGKLVFTDFNLRSVEDIKFTIDYHVSE